MKKIYYAIDFSSSYHLVGVQRCSERKLIFRIESIGELESGIDQREE